MTTKSIAKILTGFLTVFVLGGAAGAGGNSIPAAAGARSAVANYARPLSFEANQGQTDRRVDFLARGAGYSLFLSRGEAVLVLQSGTPKAESHTKWATVRMWPAGGNISARGEALEEQAGKSNYFIGNKPEQWRTGIPNYAKVRYRDVYPGVDLIYYGNQRQLEYDFVVAPGVDAGKIALEFEGAAKAELERSGDFVMHTAAGELRWHKPVAYQEINGSRKLVVCDFVRRRGGELAFAIGAYDRSKPLVVDPELVYSTYLGGSGGDRGNGIAVDDKGNIYVTGVTLSTNFPTKNAFQGTLKSAQGNAFVTKFNSSGVLVYSTYLGGSGEQGDWGNAIAVDDEAHAYVTGYTFSSDFPTKNAFQGSIHATNGGSNAFVTKLNDAGCALIYSTYLGGSAPGPGLGDAGNGIAVGSNKRAYVTGQTFSTDFPTKNPFQSRNNSKSGANAFVTEFTYSGSELIYSTYLGGDYAIGAGIAVDADGEAYVTGSTFAKFPIKNAFQPTFKGTNGGSNAFITQLKPDGDELVFSTYLGGSNDGAAIGGTGDVGSAIAVDRHGNAYVTGTTDSSDFPIKNAFQNQLKNDFGTAFVTKFCSAGQLVYSTYLGGSGSSQMVPDDGFGIAVDRAGNAYVTGVASSPDFPTKNAFQNALNGFLDAFVIELSAQGSTLVYSSYLGGSSNDFATAITVDVFGQAFVTGVTDSTDFPIRNAFQTMLAGGGDAFVTKISAQ